MINTKFNQQKKIHLIYTKKAEKSHSDQEMKNVLELSNINVIPHIHAAIQRDIWFLKCFVTVSISRCFITSKNKITRS